MLKKGNQDGPLRKTFSAGELVSEKFENKTVYDGVGRVFQEFELFMNSYRPNSGLQYNYNVNGYLKSLQETRGSSVASTVFQEVLAGCLG